MTKKPRRTAAQQRQFEKRAEKRFIRLLDKALDACYEARLENRSDVLTLNIKDLYYSLTHPGMIRT